jgi:hypothetical protein
MTIPYASATSDMRAREEIKKILRKTRQQYEQEALALGHIAVNSILRDWI